jgi:signal transduction histidine kinase
VQATRSLGLRPRLLAALVGTSVVTLAVAALALLSPLEQKLRSESERSLFTAIHATKGEFPEITIDHRNGKPDREELELTLLHVRERTGARTWVLNNKLQTISPGTPFGLEAPTYYSQAQQALRTEVGVARLSGDLFVLAEPIRIGGHRYALMVIKRLDYVASAVGVVEGAFIEAAAVGLGIALLLGIALTTTLLYRLRQLRDAALNLQRHGLATPISVKPGRDEIGELARTLIEMQSRLAHQEAALRAFVATASHELRTPLASLDGMLELIEDDLAPGQEDLDDARERTQRAREQSRRLTKLASDLLDLSRLDAEISLRTEPVELGEISRAVVAELDLRAAAKGVILRVNNATHATWVGADPGAVAQIVRILLDNALAVAPEGSAVDITTSHGADVAQIVVADHGPGVPFGERTQIFERFRRGSQGAAQGGFGLGLAIGRELAVRMGGTLELHGNSPGPATGAIFVLCLPAVAVEDDTATLLAVGHHDATT